MFSFVKFARDHRLATFTGRGEGYHVREGWIGAECPTCRGKHLGFNIGKGYFHCWRCGKLRLVEAIQSLAHLSSLSEAWELRWKYDTDEIPKEGRKARQARSRRVPEPPGLEPLSGRHLRYLASRAKGIDPEAVAEEWELRGTRGLSGDWSWRVVAPVFNKKCEIVAYVGRSILKDGKPRYKVTKDALCAEDPHNFLYGIHKAKGEAVVVVEGPGDVWNMGPGFVATMGISWRRAQAARLRHFKRRFTMYDPEEEAQRQAQKLAEWLSLFPGETENIDGLPSDPGSLSRAKVRRIRRELLGG